MRDTRVFRVTRLSGRREYCDRHGAGCRVGGNDAAFDPVWTVHAVNEEATSGWADVTSELMPWRAQEEGQ